MSKLDHDRKIPLHPIDKVAKVTPGELLPRSTHLKRAHIITLEVSNVKRGVLTNATTSCH